MDQDVCAETGAMVMTGKCCLCGDRRCNDDVSNGKYPRVDTKTRCHVCLAMRMEYLTKGGETLSSSVKSYSDLD